MNDIEDMVYANYNGVGIPFNKEWRGVHLNPVMKHYGPLLYDRHEMWLCHILPAIQSLVAQGLMVVEIEKGDYMSTIRLRHTTAREVANGLV
jgi:hypothetical protein